MNKFSLLLAPLALMPLLSSCQQQQTYPVFWYEQADGSEAGASFTIAYRNRYYVRQPLFNLSHFAKFSSFVRRDAVSEAGVPQPPLHGNAE